ncbi:hypothetical protein NQ317_004606 [Molorchus minor]|uniref:Uncharacterized protein n=1 Tax=Molorchus minor TaxID=1323400 RepID=A0ABQ9IPU4_9CUCU|nr:hypothetical protein NQ317_004606 [Molorchus minor]
MKLGPEVACMFVDDILMCFDRHTGEKNHSLKAWKLNEVMAVATVMADDNAVSLVEAEKWRSVERILVSNVDLGFLALKLVKGRGETTKRKKDGGLRTVVRNQRDYRNFLRMDQESFDNLLDLVRQDIEKKDTKMHEAIPASQRLSVTLRYLASGMDLEDLKFTCHCSQTLELIIMETCSAIIKALKENIQVMYIFAELKRLGAQVHIEVNEKNVAALSSSDVWWCCSGYQGLSLGCEMYSVCPRLGTFANYSLKKMTMKMARVTNEEGVNSSVPKSQDGWKRVAQEEQWNYKGSFQHCAYGNYDGVLKNTLFWRKLSQNQLDMPDPRELSDTSSLEMKHSTFPSIHEALQQSCFDEREKDFQL